MKDDFDEKILEEIRKHPNGISLSDAFRRINGRSYSALCDRIYDLESAKLLHTKKQKDRVLVFPKNGANDRPSQEA